MGLRRPGLPGEPAHPPGEERVREPLYQPSCGKIEQYDREKNTHYLATLETYLDHQVRPNQAAKLLFIHRNTLYQRLDKMH